MLKRLVMAIFLIGAFSVFVGVGFLSSLGLIVCFGKEGFVALICGALVGVLVWACWQVAGEL